MSGIPGPAVDALPGDPAYPSLKEYLIASTGLGYYSDKDADLARRIRRRCPGDCASYLNLLRDPARGPAEMEALIGEITIGETYFFRHREHFEALRDVVLPGLIAQNRGDRRLRIWCAGCADGAEPYSLAILLRRSLGHLLAGWEVSITGTDINRRNLEVARAGRYEQWSLRSTPEDLRRECFEETGKRWTIAAGYKTGVSFQFHNLVEDRWPPPWGDAGAFDLIVCRNVLIYFGAELMRGIVGRFHNCLAPGSWLLVGPSEPNMTHFTSFEVVNAPGVTLYRKPGLQVRDAITNWSPCMTEIASEIKPPVIPDPAPTLAALRRYADEGDWAGAARCGRELTASDRLNAAAHFHYGLVLEQMGNRAEAERSLRRALYLDRQAPLTHYHLGLLLRREEPDQAERCFSNALDALARLSADRTFGEGETDGITARELKTLVRMQLESLRNEMARVRE